MEQTSYIHQVLKNRSKEANWVYPSSILMKNENIPLFEEYFGQLDYDWLLRVTEFRNCGECEPCVIRYVSGDNLSLNEEYRKRDFYMAMLVVDGNYDAIKRMYGTRARFFYVIKKMRDARFHFFRSKINLKTILYIITSYSKILSNIVKKQFNVFG